MNLQTSFFLLTVLGLSVARAMGQCPGEPASDSPCAPRVLSGSPGVQNLVMNVTNATPDYFPACGYNLGHSVWFALTPAVSGRLTFSTCHPETIFDTIVQIWRSTGDCEFPQRLDDYCVDDTHSTSCNNGCSAYGSTVELFAQSGTTYLFQVGSYNNNAALCSLCLGVKVTLCNNDPTPPVAVIETPASLACVCGNVPVIGSAYDAEGPIDAYELQIAPAGSATWTTLATGDTAYNEVLGYIDTSSLTQGYYSLRLRATNICGLSDTWTTMIWVNGAFDTIDVRSPSDGALVGGTVCLDGTVWDAWCSGTYVAERRPATGGMYVPVDPGSPVYTSWVVNDPFALWNTGSVPDGAYLLRVTGQTECGLSSAVIRSVTVDNTSPSALISTPLSCSFVDGAVMVFGTAADANLGNWILQYTGGPAHSWVTINSGTVSVANNLLGVWQTAGLPPCAYTLRLVVSDNAVLDCNPAVTHRTEYSVSVNTGELGCPVDLTGDGDEDLEDYAEFQKCFDGS